MVDGMCYVNGRRAVWPYVAFDESESIRDKLKGWEISETPVGWVVAGYHDEYRVPHFNWVRVGAPYMVAY